MCKQLFLLLSILTTTRGWVIETNHNTVRRDLTKNVTISCHHDSNDNNTPMVVDMYRIRISKFNQNQWDTVAAMTVAHPLIETSLKDVTTSGHVDKPENTFLSIRFNEATGDTVGQFKCEVDGFDQFMNVKNIKTNPIIINEEKISHAELLKMINDLQKQETEDNSNEENDLDMLKESIQALETRSNETFNIVNDITDDVNKINTSLHTSTGQLKMSDKAIAISISTLTNRLDKINIDLMAERKDTKNTLFQAISNLTLKVDNMAVQQLKLIDLMKKLQQNNPPTTKPTDMPVTVTTTIEPAIAEWPSGAYTLLKPTSGCPSSWQFSSVRISTQPGYNNTDAGSIPLDVSGDVFQHDNGHRYVNMEMCSKVTATNGQNWPKGSYCVQAYAPDDCFVDQTCCPKGLNSGHISFGRYDDGQLDDVINVPSRVQWRSSSGTLIDYCCRDDGHPTIPINLPREQPFFLYRFGETCQVVLGMNVSNQWLKLDTVRDKGGYGDRYFPDGYGNIKNGIMLRFCLYTPAV